MSELSILELDAEQADVLPERETLFLNFQHVSVRQTAVAVADSHGFIAPAIATATNVAIVTNV